jgi:peroxiredoxin
MHHEPYSLAAGSDMPKMTLPKVGGGEINLGDAHGWQLLVVYRGKHYPICRTYLKTLNELHGQFAEIGVDVAAISGDTAEKAGTEAGEEGWLFRVGHSLTLDQMRALGLHISNPRSAQETDRPFPEPGLLVVNPEGKIKIIDISNAPFARPDLNSILKGVKFIQEQQYPIRGTVA